MGILGVKPPEPDILKKRIIENILSQMLAKPLLSVGFQNKEVQQVRKYRVIRT